MTGTKGTETMDTDQLYFELHLAPSPDFTRKGYGELVRDAGGDYSHARGHADERLVRVPAADLDLVEELLVVFAKYKRTFAIVRGRGIGDGIVFEVPGKSVVGPDTPPSSAVVALRVRRHLDLARARIARRNAEEAEAILRRPDELRAKIERLEAELRATHRDLVHANVAAGFAS